MRTTRSRRFLLVIGGTLFFVSLLTIARFLAQPADIWWTPRSLAVPLADVSDRVEIYVRGVALQEHVQGGRVQLLTDTGVAPVTASDTRLRFNNWDRVRAERIPSLLAAATGLGASGVLLLFGVLGWGPAGPVRPQG